MKSNNIICSAGFNYCMVQWDGSIFKCYAHNDFKDYSLTKLKIGNIKNKDFFDLEISPLCERYCCNEYCDMLGTQQWNNQELINDSKKMMLWPVVEKFEQLDENNFTVCVDLVSGCQNKCPYCWLTKNKMFDLRHIEGTHWINFIKYISSVKKGIKFFNISGLGEPTVHPDFCQIINEALISDFHVAVTTSALNLNNKKLKQILSGLSQKEKNKFSIIISLHPLSPLWSQEKLEELLKEFKNNNYTNIYFNFVNFSQNMKFKEELIKMGEKYDIKEFRSVDYLDE